MKFKTILGKSAELTSERKKHVFLFHPDLKPYFGKVEDVLLEPSEVRISQSDPKVLLFYKYFDNIFYDTEADVLYFSKGTPSAEDTSDEVDNEIVIRKNPKTKEVTGFTILNFSQKSKKSSKSFGLPIEIDLRSTIYP